MSLGWTLVLQWADLTSHSRDCFRFADLPLLDPAQIAVVGEASRLGDCQSLFQSLNKQIVQLRGTSLSASPCGGAVPINCKARVELNCRSVLVVLLNDQPISSAVSSAMLDWQQRRPLNSIVLPVLPQGADPNRVLPSPLNRLIVLREPLTWDELVPDILKTAGVGSEEFRLFISYRRLDCSDLADQLFAEFSRAGFDVFLDRFRGRPGRNFPQLLNEQLIDKGLVVVLESPKVHQSPWTQAEVQFAGNFRLGLISVRMPGGRTFRSIPTSDRFDATNPGQWNDGLGTLPSSTLIDASSVVQFVRNRFGMQTLKRQIYLESLLGLALAHEGLTSTRQVTGTHRISSSRDYVVAMSSRPPVLDTVRRVCDAAQKIADQQVVVGPNGLASPQQSSNMSWLSKRLQVEIRDESTMINLARSIKQGASLP